MKSILNICLFLFFPILLLAQEPENMSWDTIFVIDGDTTDFTIKGSPQKIEALKEQLEKLTNKHKSHFADFEKDFTGKFEWQVAEDFEATDIDQQKHSLYSYRGQVVVLYFWAVYDQASWVEYESYNKLYQEFFEQGAMVIGLCNDDEKEVNYFRNKIKTAYPIIPNCREFGLKYYGGEYGSGPRVFVIDKMGMIRHCFTGGSDKDGLEKYRQLKPLIENLLKE